MPSQQISYLFRSTSAQMDYIRQWENFPELGACPYKIQGNKRKREEDDAREQDELDFANDNEETTDKEKEPFSGSEDGDEDEAEFSSGSEDEGKCMPCDPLSPPATPRLVTNSKNPQPRKVRCIDGDEFSNPSSRYHIIDKPHETYEQRLYPLRLTAQEQERIIMHCHVKEHGSKSFKLGSIRSQKELYDKIVECYPKPFCGDLRNIAKARFTDWWVHSDERTAGVMYTGFDRWSWSSPQLNKIWESLEHAVKEGMVDTKVKDTEILVAEVEIDVVKEFS